MNNNDLRVRFAPSPTGYLHVGGLRTALYNYLFAKQNNGKFILRIEDTDRNRFVEGAEEQLINSLNWAGLQYDEGPDKEGEHGPYRQSERLDIYKKYSDQLISQGDAYYCFCTQERLQALREEQQKQKLPQAKYDKHCLNLSNNEIENNLNEGKPFVIRLNVKPGMPVAFNDAVKGRIEFHREVIDDQVLIKGDGFPTYHMANVVDDHLMKISHVIRGEEWLSSTPKHVLLYNSFGWELPIFAHLPLLLNPDRTKLSKRQGDVAVEDYRDKGYLQKALVNFVALLGWGPQDNQEILNIEELLQKFSLDRVNSSSAIFNVEKLNWLNEQHLKLTDRNELLEILKSELSNSKYEDHQLSDEILLMIIESMIERITFVKDIITNSPYFFEAPVEYDETVIAKRWKENSAELLDQLKEEYLKIEAPAKEDYENALRKVADANGVGAGKIIHPLRLAVSGVGGGPGLFDITAIIGKDETVRRIESAIKKIKIG